MKNNINYEAPEDWGVSSEDAWVSFEELIPSSWNYDVDAALFGVGISFPPPTTGTDIFA